MTLGVDRPTSHGALTSYAVELRDTTRFMETGTSTSKRIVTVSSPVIARAIKTGRDILLAAFSTGKS
jgi:hypothetical protein